MITTEDAKARTQIIRQEIAVFENARRQIDAGAAINDLSDDLFLYVPKAIVIQVIEDVKSERASGLLKPT